MRVVSLLPSATEMVAALGLADRLVGVTHECDFPPRVRGLPAVTRTLIPPDRSSGEIDALVRQRLASGAALYALDRPVLEALRPELIVTQTLCRVCAVSEDDVNEALSCLPGAPKVLSLEPESLGEVLDAIRAIARATGLGDAGEAVARRLRSRVEAVATRSEGVGRRPRVVYLEWLDPPFSSGHWGPELVRLAGGEERLGVEGERSRTLSWAEVVAADPEVVFIACCGFDRARALRDLPILESVPGWRETSAARSGRVYLSDGSQYFSRPGPRLVDSLEILAHALHPERHPLPYHLPAALRVGAARSPEGPPGGSGGCPDSRPGLCGACRHRRIVTSGRGSSFLLCRRSETDPSFPKYPRLPVAACGGFEAESRPESGTRPEEETPPGERPAPGR